MKILKGLGKLSTKIRVLLLILLLSSCNTIKKVGDSEYLLTKNTIYVDSLKVNSAKVKNLISQKPNTKLLLGYPLRLNLYNLAKDNPDSLYQNWLQKKPKRYFNNKASYTVVPNKRKKRAEIAYNVTLGKPYFIDSLTTNILSSDIDSLLNINKGTRYVKEKEQFDVNDFIKERQRLTKIFRNSGIYNFQESAISFDILRDTTNTGNDQKLDVQMDSGIQSTSIRKNKYLCRLSF